MEMVCTKSKLSLKELKELRTDRLILKYLLRRIFFAGEKAFTIHGGNSESGEGQSAVLAGTKGSKPESMAPHIAIES